MLQLRKAIRAFISDESGATMVEYAIMVALIAAVAIVIVGKLGTAVNNKFTNTCTAINNNTACP